MGWRNPCGKGAALRGHWPPLPEPAFCSSHRPVGTPAAPECTGPATSARAGSSVGEPRPAGRGLAPIRVRVGAGAGQNSRTPGNCRPALWALLPVTAQRPAQPGPPARAPPHRRRLTEAQAATQALVHLSPGPSKSKVLKKCASTPPPSPRQAGHRPLPAGQAGVRGRADRGQSRPRLVAPQPCGPTQALALGAMAGAPGCRAGAGPPPSSAPCSYGFGGTPRSEPLRAVPHRPGGRAVCLADGQRLLCVFLPRPPRPCPVPSRDLPGPQAAGTVRATPPLQGP